MPPTLRCCRLPTEFPSCLIFIGQNAEQHKATHSHCTGNLTLLLISNSRLLILGTTLQPACHSFRYGIRGARETSPPCFMWYLAHQCRDSHDTAERRLCFRAGCASYARSRANMEEKLWPTSRRPRSPTSTTTKLKSLAIIFAYSATYDCSFYHRRSRMVNM